MQNGVGRDRGGWGIWGVESVSSISDAFLRPQISNNVHLINTVSAHYRILVEHQTYMT